MQKYNTTLPHILVLCLVLFPALTPATEFYINKLNVNKHTSNQTTRSLIKANDGFLWYATDSNVWRFDGYESKPFSEIVPYTKTIKKTKKLFMDSQSQLWIGTAEDGLIRFSNNEILTFSTSSDQQGAIKSNRITAITEDENQQIWFGTDRGLHHISDSSSVSSFSFPSSFQSEDSQYITALLNISANEMLVSTRTSLLSFDKEQYIYTVLYPDNNHKNLFILSLYQDQEQNIWMATDRGIYIRHKGTNDFKTYRREELGFAITSVAVTEDDIWLGSFSKGLYKVSRANGKIFQYQHHKDQPYSLSSDTINSLLLDQSGLLWISTFSGGINYIDTNSLTFGLENDSMNSVYCAQTNEFGGFLQDQSGVLWIASDGGLIQWNEDKGICVNHNKDKDSGAELEQLNVQSIMQDSQGQLWLSTRLGLKKLDINSGLLESVPLGGLKTGINFTIEESEGTFLIGTWRGLYRYHLFEQQVELIQSSAKKLSLINIYNVQTGSDKQLFFSSPAGVLTINQDLQLEVYENIQSQLPTYEVISILVDDKAHLWVGTFQHGLFQFDEEGALLHRYNESNNLPTTTSILSMEQDREGNIWLGTEYGLVKLNSQTKWAQDFHKSDGLQDDYFKINASYHAPDGRLYFSGRNGFNRFDPTQISVKVKEPKVVLTDFTRFGKTVVPGQNRDGFTLHLPINELDSLVLGHKDYVIGFEFSALDFADPSRNQYAYQMEGLDPEWTHVDAENRRISYSNLKSGDYIFKVKAANKNGVWNEQGKSLIIKVLPPPWLTWWAISGYVFMVIFTVWWVLHRKNKANAEITRMLRVEVDKKTKTLKQQTHELEVQKQTVETLLARKNELFANVSHEFRTPLTLIIGPVNQLLKKDLRTDDIQTLNTINRNANRLLTMIEELLELAKITDKEKTRFVTYQTALHVDAIVRSFEPLAQEKNISLLLQENVDVVLRTTDHAMEIVLGNLLSNAIKYTPSEGEVVVRARSIDPGLYYLEIKDTGPGMDAHQKIKIFNRFERLDSHQNVEGVGIGLSVVEEILKVNNAQIEVYSLPGTGSTFKVTFETAVQQTDITIDKPSPAYVNQLVTDTHLSMLSPPLNKGFSNHHHETILIIDDNHDMRHYIADTLESNYTCLLAPSGKKGVAQAIEHIPDVIICDVMMPEMDGFQVSKALRSDARTSHIPLILLTALDNKQSRIRGWREHVDVYLTKPFDENELKIQLENILVIRNILKRKAGGKIKAGESSSNIDLPEVDQKFVNKLNQLIKDNYHNANYQRPNMASDMAVSVKQLQRKIKALIDKNPMDLLREYRLEKATDLLKKGNQVGIVSADCGFNSLSYFSQCFKAQYGFSPKKYQQICLGPSPEQSL